MFFDTMTFKEAFGLMFRGGENLICPDSRGSRLRT